MLNYLQKWIDQLRWQRLPSFQKLAEMLLKHLVVTIDGPGAELQLQNSAAAVVRKCPQGG
jgi:hypothetical protein